MWMADLRAVTFSSSSVLRVVRPAALRCAARDALADLGSSAPLPSFEEDWSRYESERARRRWEDQVEVPIESVVPRTAAPWPNESFATAVADRFGDSLEWQGDVLPALDYLREAGFRTVLLADLPVPLSRAWQERSKPWFDEVVTSRDLARRTPDPAAFHETLRRLRIGPHGLLHVGAGIVEDVHAAKALQMRAALLERFGRPPPDPEAVAWLRRVHGLDAATVTPDLRLGSLEDLPFALDAFA